MGHQRTFDAGRVRPTARQPEAPARRRRSAPASATAPGASALQASSAAPRLSRSPLPASTKLLLPSHAAERRARGLASVGAGARDRVPLGPALRAAIELRRGRGDPLDARTRARAEVRHGCSLAGVRVHHDLHARRLARRMGAHAFTVGEDVFMGEARPERRPEEVLDHELVHVADHLGGAELAVARDEIAGGTASGASRFGSVSFDLAEGTATVILGSREGTPWATVRFDPTGPVPRVELVGRHLDQGYDHGFGLGLRVSGGEDVVIELDRRVESTATDSA